MKLFTKAIDNKLFEQYHKGSNLEEQVVVAKIFNPYGRGTWYLINSDPNDPDYIWAIVDLFEKEVGSVSRSELENIKVPPFNLGLERDLGFEQVNAKQLFKELRGVKDEEDDVDGDDEMADGGIIPMSELPADTQAQVEAGKVTYRGMGMGKEGTKIKVHGKEYVISDEDFKALGGIDKIRFSAPARKHEEGGEVGEMAEGGTIAGENLVLKDDNTWFKISDEEEKEIEQERKWRESLSWQEQHEYSPQFAEGGTIEAQFDKWDFIGMKVKTEVVMAVGIDEAVRVKNMEWVISPYALLERAVYANLLSPIEINEGVWFAAVQEAEDINSTYLNSGEGIGSSDVTYFIKYMLDNAGLKTDFVDGRLCRVDSNGVVVDI